MRLRLPGRNVPRKDTAVGVGILLILVALLPFGCAQYDSDVGSSIVGGGFEGEVREITFPVTRDTTRTLGDQYKVLQASLPVGSQDGFHSRMLLRYQNFTFGDTLLGVSEANIWLKSSGFLDSTGMESFAPWEAEVLRIDDWYDITQLRYDDNLSLTPLDTFTVDPAADSVLIHLDEETLFRWVNDTLDYGLMIRPLVDANYIQMYFLSPADTTQLPKINAIATFEEDDSLYTDRARRISPTVSSTFLVDDERTFGNAEHLYLSTGYIRDAMFYGDFSQFDPGNVSINRVQMVVKVDTTWQYAFGDQTKLFTWGYLTSDWFSSPLDSVQIGSDLSSSSYGDYFFRDDSTTFLDSMVVDITPIVRTWVARPEENFGVLFRYQLEGDLMRRAALFSAEATDPENRPYFRVTYTEYNTP